LRALPHRHTDCATTRAPATTSPTASPKGETRREAIRGLKLAREIQIITSPPEAEPFRPPDMLNIYKQAAFTHDRQALGFLLLRVRPHLLLR
jgi:hypothetical protein